MANEVSRIAGRVFICAVWMVLVALPSEGRAEPLPRATQKILHNLKLDPSILSGLDQELNVPKAWIQGAKKEGKVQVRGTPASSREINSIYAPFKERYPFIEFEYSGSNRQGRTVTSLMAYKSGRVLSDIIYSVGAFVTEFEKAGGLEDLRPLPSLAKVPDGVKGPNGAWTGTSMLYWCIAYNTRRVKKADLPRKWDDLLDNPVWRDGNFALGNRPNLFVGNLWMVKGEHWAKDFVVKLFTEVKPQLRKEGMSSLAQLAAAGEFYGVAPSNYRRVFQMAEEGAPVSFHCPEPVPTSTEEAVILKGSAHPNAARVFLNWLLSKEGQIARYYGGEWSPVHKELMRKEFLPFSEEIVGKEQAFRDPERIDEVMPPLFDYWNALWLKGGGKTRR